MEKTKIDSVKQLPVMPLTIEEMTWNKTGAWRLLTPEARDKTPPCRAACPLGQAIPEFIQAVQDRDWDRALGLLLEINPLPGVTGRLCYHPCQVKCFRKELDRAIFIQKLEKTVADRGKSPIVTKHAPSGKNVAVCGAGPAGLAAAYRLAVHGCRVTLLEPGDRTGGFLKDASPEKLQSPVLEREISRLVAVSGIRLRTKATALPAEEYDLLIVDRTAHRPGSDEARAVEALAGSGAHRLDIEGREGSSGFKAVHVAHAVALGRDIAFEALQHLSLIPEEMGQGPRQVVKKKDIKFRHVAAAMPAALLARVKGAADEDVVLEATRCLSCGTCNLCQRCVLSCPDACCILDEEKGKIVVDLYHCKGCGICAYECPRGVLVMESLP